MHNELDVLVIGGGTAGSIAALSAARFGARTRLVETAGFLGGTCHALGNITPFHNSRGEQIVGGLPQELVDRIGKAGGLQGSGHLPNPTGIGGSFTPVDPDLMKRILLEMATESGIDLWLHTRFLSPLMTGNRITGATVATKAGVERVSARVVIDATGDADVAVSAKVPFHQDVPEAALNASLLFRVAGVDSDVFIDDVRKSPEKIVLLADPYLRDIEERRPADVMQKVQSIYDCPYIYLSNIVRDYVPRKDWDEWGITGLDKSKWGALQPFGSRFSIMPMPNRKDIFTLNVTSITFDATNVEELSRAELEGQRQLHLAVDVLRRYVPGFRRCFLHSVMPGVSIRSSRRIVGEYMLTREDVESRRRFPDGIAKGAYPMSVQSPDKPGVRQHLFVPGGGDYDVPYRCLVPKEIEGLLVAGRCLSATREAIGSARMGAQCMAYGQAAGVAAGLAVRTNSTPRGIDVTRLREELRAQQAIC